jgi:ATP-dependent exoDNAse (exonuclease V) alpha subunit
VAIAYLNASMISGGQSPVASAAYRHRASMMDASDERVVSYAHKKADLAHEEIAIPADAPAWVLAMLDGKSVAKSSEALWNAVVDAETRVDAQFSRDIMVALPNELTREQNIALVREFVAKEITANTKQH